MSKPRLTVAAAAAAFALMAGSSWAQSPQTGAASGSSASRPSAASPQAGSGQQKEQKLARGDRKFMEKAARDGQFEIQAAQIAATKATDPAIKSYANELVRDHTQAQEQLRQLASKAGVELPAKLSRSENSKLEKLQKLSGKDFDQYYAKEIVDAHQKDVKTFQKEAKDLKDPQLQAWAQATMPVLEKHLAQAKQLPEAGGGNAKRMGSSGAPAGQPSGASTASPSGASGTRQ